MMKVLRQTRLGIFLAGAATLLLSASGQALAREEVAKGPSQVSVPARERPEVVGIQDPSQESSAQGAVRTFGAVASPGECKICDCKVRAHRPHLSRHAEDKGEHRVNGEIRIECEKRKPELRVTAELWETRWWGWDRLNDHPSEKKKHNGRKVSAFANAGCNPGMTVRVTGDGYVTYRDGKTLSGGVESEHITFDKCTRR